MSAADRISDQEFMVSKDMTQEKILDNTDYLKAWGFSDSVCHNCGKTNAQVDGRLMQCATCKIAYYCSNSCFSTHQCGDREGHYRSATAAIEKAREKEARREALRKKAQAMIAGNGRTSQSESPQPRRGRDSTAAHARSRSADGEAGERPGRSKTPGRGQNIRSKTPGRSPEKEKKKKKKKIVKKKIGSVKKPEQLTAESNGIIKELLADGNELNDEIQDAALDMGAGVGIVPEATHHPAMVRPESLTLDDDDDNNSPPPPCPYDDALVIVVDDHTEDADDVDDDELEMILHGIPHVIVHRREDPSRADDLMKAVEEEISSIGDDDDSHFHAVFKVDSSNTPHFWGTLDHARAAKKDGDEKGDQNVLQHELNRRASLRRFVSQAKPADPKDRLLVVYASETPREADVLDQEQMAEFFMENDIVCDTLDAADVENRATRDELLAISKELDLYPQFFSVPPKTDSGRATKFLGTWNADRLADPARKDRKSVGKLSSDRLFTFDDSVLAMARGVSTVDNDAVGASEVEDSYLPGQLRRASLSNSTSMSSITADSISSGDESDNPFTDKIVIIYSSLEADMHDEILRTFADRSYEALDVEDPNPTVKERADALLAISEVKPSLFTPQVFKSDEVNMNHYWGTWEDIQESMQDGTFAVDVSRRTCLRRFNERRRLEMEEVDSNEPVVLLVLYTSEPQTKGELDDQKAMAAYFSEKDIVYDSLNGATTDPDLMEQRGELFKISKRPHQYPQFFEISPTEPPKYLGGWTSIKRKKPKKLNQNPDTAAALFRFDDALLSPVHGYGQASAATCPIQDDSSYIDPNLQKPPSPRRFTQNVGSILDRAKLFENGTTNDLSKISVSPRKAPKPKIRPISLGEDEADN